MDDPSDLSRRILDDELFDDGPKTLFHTTFNKRTVYLQLFKFQVAPRVHTDSYGGGIEVAATGALVLTRETRVVVVVNVVGGRRDIISIDWLWIHALHFLMRRRPIHLVGTASSAGVIDPRLDAAIGLC